MLHESNRNPAAYQSLPFEYLAVVADGLLQEDPGMNCSYN